MGSSMSEDYLRSPVLSRMWEDPSTRQEAERTAQGSAYYDILEMCSLANVNWEDIVPAPMTARPTLIDPLTRANQQRKGEDMYQILNAEQKETADTVLDRNEKLIFVDGPGGSGKTFLNECVSNVLKGRGQNVVCCAWTGVSANLLPEGRTIASLFKLSIEEDCRRSTMQPNSVDGKYLKSIDTFIIDECSMLAYWMLDTIDTLLKDIHNNTLTFGGRQILLGGDFRQVLPIPSKASGLEQFQACLKNSALFKLFRKFNLTSNVRAATESDDWKKFLLDVGDGKAEEDSDGKIAFPDTIESNGDLISEIFEGAFDRPDLLATRAILCAKNKQADKINHEVLNKLPGETHVFVSQDDVGRDSREDSLMLPTEFLNSLCPSGFPAHRLELKEGAIVILLRNLCVKRGLCNGTRLRVASFGHTNVINCQFISGPRVNEYVQIPRIGLKTKQGLSFEFYRRQFPLRLAFAMTINKSQGQSLDRVGIDLTDEVFSHGQLHVAMSRCKTMVGVRIFTADRCNKTKNVVDKRVFLDP